MDNLLLTNLYKKYKLLLDSFLKIKLRTNDHQIRDFRWHYLCHLSLIFAIEEKGFTPGTRYLNSRLSVFTNVK